MAPHCPGLALTVVLAGQVRTQAVDVQHTDTDVLIFKLHPAADQLVKRGTQALVG